VKKYARDAEGRVWLQPANPEMLPLCVRGDRVRIIGVVAGVLRKFGFGEARPAAAPPRPPRTPRPQARAATATDPASLDLEVNIIDTQLARWRAAIDQAKRDRRLRKRVVHLEELVRDLQALRDWCARTQKLSLRRALIAEANKVIRRLQRFSPVVPLTLSDATVH